MYSPQASTSFSFPSNIQTRPYVPNIEKSNNFNKNQIANQRPNNLNFSYRQSQRNDNQIKQAPISNASYVLNRAQSPRMQTTNAAGNKLTEMSTDLAKLKQQLNRIMSQADKFEKKQNNRSQIQTQNLQYPNQNDQKVRKPQIPFLNEDTTKIAQKQLNLDNAQYQRVTSPSNLSNRNLINGSISPSSNLKDTNFNKSFNQLKNSQQKIIHSESQKKFNFNNKLKNEIHQASSYQKQTKEKISLENQNQTYIQSRPISSSSKKVFNFNEISNDSYGFPQNKNNLNSSRHQQPNVSDSLRKDSQFNQNLQKNNNTQSYKQWNFDSFTKQKSIRTESSPVYDTNFQQNSSFPKPQQQFKIQSTPIYDQKFTSNSNFSKPIADQFVPTLSQKSTLQNSTYLSKKDSSKSRQQSSQQLLNKIINEQLTKKLQKNNQVSLLKQQKVKQQLQYQQKIISLEHQNRKLRHQINSNVLERQNIQLMLKTQKSQKQNIMRKYNQLETLLLEHKRQAEEYRAKCKILETKLEAELSRPKTKRSNQVTSSFDQALKQQFTQISSYKDKLQQKDQQIIRLKDLCTMNRRQIQSLNNQIKIQQIKSVSQLNQAEQKNSVQLQDKQNQIKSYKNLVQTLQSKLSFAIKQNKTKDNFMVQHLTGKAKTASEKQYIQQFFKDYVVQFPTNGFAQKLKQQQVEIQKLKRTIVQMAIKR